jgi:NADPH2:quinone reductase
MESDTSARKAPVKAILCTRLGGPDDLELADLPMPVAGAGEAVVAIKAVGLNFYDTLIIAGKYQTKPPLPFSPGGEFAGVIESVGAGVDGVTPGDRVLGYTSYGSARQYAAVAADRLFPIPHDLDFDRAAGLNITYGTAYHALKDRAALRAGETLAVLGASGGVGIAAVELGKRMGARVIACASSDEKLAFARQHGADVPVNYAKSDLRKALKEAGGEHGIDVIYDPVGGDATEAAIRSIAWDGRFLVVGFASGAIPKLPLNLTLLKGCNVLGVNWGAFVRDRPQAYREGLGELTRWAAERTLSCHIHAAYPLAEMAQGLKDIAGRKAMGKVILHP